MDAKIFLLDTLDMKDWNVCVTKDEEGNEVFMAGGRVTTDLKPGPGGWSTLWICLVWSISYNTVLQQRKGEWLI